MERSERQTPSSFLKQSRICRILDASDEDRSRQDPRGSPEGPAGPQEFLRWPRAPSRCLTIWAGHH
eukprot:1152535-Pyramimonas_sp.AAC.1